MLFIQITFFIYKNFYKNELFRKNYCLKNSTIDVNHGETIIMYVQINVMIGEEIVISQEASH